MCIPAAASTVSTVTPISSHIVGWGWNEGCSPAEVSSSSVCFSTVSDGCGTQNSWLDPRSAASTISGTAAAAQAATADPTAIAARRRHTSASSCAGMMSAATKPQYKASPVHATYPSHTPRPGGWGEPTSRT